MYGSARKHLQKTIEDIKADGLFKDERIIASPQKANIKIRGGMEVRNFCANNYLGLAAHKEVIEAAKSSYDNWGYGLSSVRFICGTQEIHKELEVKISEFLVLLSVLDMDMAVVFNKPDVERGGNYRRIRSNKEQSPANGTPIDLDEFL